MYIFTVMAPPPVLPVDSVISSAAEYDGCGVCYTWRDWQDEWVFQPVLMEACFTHIYTLAMVIFMSDYLII